MEFPDNTATKISIGILLDFLTSYGDQMCRQGRMVRQFERLTTEELAKLSDNSALCKVLRQAGWVGTRYQYSASCPVDVDPLKQMLASLYIACGANCDTSGGGDDEDSNVIKSFCPDALVRCARRHSEHGRPEAELRARVRRRHQRAPRTSEVREPERRQQDTENQLVHHLRGN